MHFAPVHWTELAADSNRQANWTNELDPSQLQNSEWTELNGGTLLPCPNWTERTFQTNWCLGYWTVLNWCETILNFEQEDIVSLWTLLALELIYRKTANGLCAQTSRHKNIVNTLKRSELTASCFSRWLHHPECWTPHSMMKSVKMAKIYFQTVCYVKFSSDFEKLIRYFISAF